MENELQIHLSPVKAVWSPLSEARGLHTALDLLNNEITPAQTGAPATGGSRAEVACHARLNLLPYQLNAAGLLVCVHVHLLPLLARCTVRAALQWQWQNGRGEL